MEAKARDFINKLIPPDLLGELYGDDRWNGLPAGESPLQIGVRNAFGAIYEDQWNPGSGTQCASTSVDSE